MSPLKVTVFLAVGLCLFTTYINADEAKDNADDDENTIKIYKRLIPADVLRGLYRYYSCFLSHLLFFVFVFCMQLFDKSTFASSEELCILLQANCNIRRKARATHCVLKQPETGGKSNT